MTSPIPGPRTKLGTTGLEVCRLGFGGIPIQRLTEAEAVRLIGVALDGGIDFYDTAAGYTDSQRKLGAGLAGHRDRVVIASKSMARGAEAIAADLDRALSDLRTEYLDVYQLHNVASMAELEQVTAPGGALDGLLKARDAGKVRYIGLSSHKPAVALQALERFPFATVQVPVNYIETLALPELVPAARRRGVGTIAMKPVGGGAFVHRTENFRFIFAAGIDVAIPGMDDPRQVAENLAVLSDLRPLTVAETALLEQEKKELGDTFCRRCEYCMPCPNGLPIAFLHVLRAYWFRYGLKDWVHQRLAALKKTYRDCTGCGECVGKCPYHLPSPELFAAMRDEIERSRN